LIAVAAVKSLHYCRPLSTARLFDVQVNNPELRRVSQKKVFSFWDLRDVAVSSWTGLTLSCATRTSAPALFTQRICKLLAWQIQL